MLITGATARYRARPGSLQGLGHVGPKYEPRPSVLRVQSQRRLRRTPLGDGAQEDRERPRRCMNGCRFIPCEGSTTFYVLACLETAETAGSWKEPAASARWRGRFRPYCLACLAAEQVHVVLLGFQRYSDSILGDCSSLIHFYTILEHYTSTKNSPKFCSRTEHPSTKNSPRAWSRNRRCLQNVIHVPALPVH